MVLMDFRKGFRSSWYMKWYHVLTLSFCLALYLNWPTQFIRIVDLLQMQIFWKALFFSWLLSMIIIWLIGLLYLWLDKRYPWKSKLWYRINLQFLLGCMVPLLLILGIVRYFYFKDQQSFIDSGYLVLEFPVVVAGLLAINFIFYGLSINRNEKRKPKKLKCLVKGKFRTVAQEEIIILRRKQNTGSLLLKDGSEGRMDYLIEDLENLLDPQKFFTINRSTIVALDCIKGWVPVGNGQFLLEMRYNVFKDAKLTVSRRRKHSLEALLTGQLVSVVSF